ncbi:Clp protease N-terminal domain-containing protein [Streptomyces sp. NPDC091279]|uniref:Clp protease N-terminal domain-containing protein n=1 Tax=Streptomyces sp. NPDC091279 TaxID=3365983 RepID=UPI00382E1719
MTRERPTPAVTADAEDVPRYEFESDVTDLLARTARRAVRLASGTTGTEHLLFTLVRGDTEAGAALAPGLSDAGALSGLVAGRAGGVWVHHDDADDATAVTPADEAEVSAAWREARWLAAPSSSGALPDGRTDWPEPSGALRGCLLRALRRAREEGTPGVRTRHVARALLDLPGSRAVEALTLRRVDRAGAAAALDAQAATEAGPELRTLELLRRAGLLGERGTWWARALVSWTSRTSGDGTPVLFTIGREARRQAVRCGRRVAEPVDLLLAIHALDRALTVAGRTLPEDVRTANSAAALMRSHGVQPGALLVAATETEPAPVTAEVPFSAGTERVMGAARLLAAEHNARTVGTVHLLAALLDDAAADADADPDVDRGGAGDADGSPVARLLRQQGLDTAELSRQLGSRLGA